MNNQPIRAGIYAANQVVVSESKILNGTTVQMQAQQTVRLKSGFSVAAGNRFKAYIAACDSTLNLQINAKHQTKNKQLLHIDWFGIISVIIV